MTVAVQFHISFTSGKPVYLQVVDQVKTAAAAGTVQPGDLLPSIRPLAEALRLNRNTIAKAYSALEHQGIIESFPGKGSFIRDQPSPYRKEVRLKLLTDEVDEAVVQAHHLQIGRTEFLRLAEERYDAIERKRTRAANG